MQGAGSRGEESGPTKCMGCTNPQPCTVRNQSTVCSRIWHRNSCSILYHVLCRCQGDRRLVPACLQKVVCRQADKVDVRLPGKGNSNSHDARPVHLIIPMIKWIRTSRLSIKNSLSLSPGGIARRKRFTIRTNTPNGHEVALPESGIALP